VVRIVTSGQQSDLLESTLAEFDLKPWISRDTLSPAELHNTGFAGEPTYQKGWTNLSKTPGPDAFWRRAIPPRLNARIDRSLLSQGCLCPH